MKLECFVINGKECDIHPASHRRGWMDQTPDAYAYRCLPLSIANSHGWEIRCTETFEAEWNGGEKAGDVQVYPADGNVIGVSNGFGSGILSFEGKAIFRTPAGYNLWVSGPVNQFKDGIQPLTAIVESDWMPFSFTMNWKFTRPNLRVRFEKGEPYCVLFPIQRALIEAFEPEKREIGSDPELEKQYTYAHNMRVFESDLKRIKESNGLEGTAKIKNVNAIRWQGWYMKGQLPDGSASIPSHKRKLRIKPFK